MFKLFGRVEEGEKLNKNGIGLGLTIAKKIVEQYNGYILVDSLFGRGTKFTFGFEVEEA